MGSKNYSKIKVRKLPRMKTTSVILLMLVSSSFSMMITRKVDSTTSPFANSYYYGNPTSGCRSDEKTISVSGFPGDSCAPKMNSDNTCPTSPVAPGDWTAQPMPTVKDASGQFYCLMVCAGLHIGTCPQGTACVFNGLFGVCFWNQSENKVLSVLGDH